MEAIPAWLLDHSGNLGFAGLVSLAIVLILTGRLIPRSSVEALREDWNDRLQSKEQQVQDWKGAYLKSLEVQTAQGDQIRELLEHSRTTAYFIQALATQGKSEKAP